MSNQQIVKDPIKSTTTTKNEDDIKDESSKIKGPPLGSSTHTIQLFVLLGLNSVLIFLCLFVLPLHLFWRQIGKQDAILNPDPEIIIESVKNKSFVISQLAKDSFDFSKQNNHPLGTNLITSFKLMFSAPSSDTTIQNWIRKGIRSTLTALVLLQGWFLSRFKGWWDESSAMEIGDREEVMKRRRIGIGKQMENVTMTSFILPIFTIGFYLIITIFGAPLLKNNLDTLFLSGFIVVLALFPSIHVLGSDQNEWFKAFSFSEPAFHATQNAPRFKILINTTICTLLGALIGSAGFLLDWDKAWQVYPVPAILGAGIGSLIGNVFAGLAYFFAAPSRSAGPMVERKAKSFFSTGTKSNNNVNKKKKKR